MPSRVFVLRNALVFPLLLLVFLISFNKVSNTDAWLHLSLGRLIWENMGFPEKEMYTYPVSDGPFSYSSWIFGLVYYLSWHFFNGFGVVFLKALTVAFSFYFLARDSLRPYGNAAAAVFTLTGAVIVSSYRFVERPDTFAMVFLSSGIWALNAFLYERKKYIYSLPFIHMLWGNSHSSIVLMFIPFTAFIAGGLLQRYLATKGIGEVYAPDISQLKAIMFMFLLSLAASLINPYFAGQYVYGYMHLAPDIYKEMVMEIQPPYGEWKILAFTASAVISLSFALNYRRFSVIHLMLVLPFMALSLSAIRFIYLAAIVGGPVTARNISSFIEERGLSGFFRKKAVTTAVAVYLVFFGFLALSGARPFSVGGKEFGFGFLHTHMPEGAVNYMERRKINDRVLNSTAFGQYIIWKRYPKNTVFVDSRLDIPEGLIEKLRRFRYSRAVSDELYSAYGFNSILIGYSDSAGREKTALDLSFRHPAWALVYWDDKSLFYLRRDAFDKIVREDEYRFIDPDLTLSSFTKKINDENREGLIRELRRNIEETGSSLGHLYLGSLYLKTGLYREAIGTLMNVREDRLRVTSSLLSGDAYMRLGDIESGLDSYKKALCVRETAEAHYKIGAAYLAMKMPRDALKHLRKTLQLNGNLTNAYPLLIATCRILGMEQEVVEAELRYSHLRSIDLARAHFNNGIKAYREKKYDIAISELEESISINPSNPSAYLDIGFIYLDTLRPGLALEYFDRALSIKPDFAKAHYGFALAHRMTGNPEEARRHFMKYLQYEPSGYYSRKAKKELVKLGNDNLMHPNRK